MIQALQADSLRAVLDTVFAAPKYEWVPRSDPLGWFLRLVRDVLGWFAELGGDHPDLYWAVIFLLVVVLVVILVHAGYLAVRAMRYASVPESRGVRVTATRRDANWYRAEAQRAARAGRYSEAIRAWFDAMVLELDERGAVRWHPSKTPREYAREARLRADDRARLAGLVDGVYAYSYAGVPCGAQEWEAWRTSTTGGWNVD